MPAKEDKGDAVLAVNFVLGSVSTVLHCQQDGVLWFIEVSRLMCSKVFKQRLAPNSQ